MNISKLISTTSTGLFALIIITILMIPSFAEAQKNQQKKPNIIFILADDLGIGDVG